MSKKARAKTDKNKQVAVLDSPTIKIAKDGRRFTEKWKLTAVFNGWKGGRPPKYEKVEEVQEICLDYIKDSVKNKTVMHKQGFCLRLNINLETLAEWRRDRSHRFSATADMIHEVVHGGLANELYNRRGSLAGIIFGLKNNYGYVDKQEITVKRSGFDDIFGNMTTEHSEQAIEGEVIEDIEDS